MEGKSELASVRRVPTPTTAREPGAHRPGQRPIPAPAGLSTVSATKSSSRSRTGHNSWRASTTRDATSPRSLETSYLSTAEELPAQDLRYRLVGHLNPGADLEPYPVDIPAAKTSTTLRLHREAPVASAATTRTPPR
jgi:hypothetical protein